MNGRGVVVSGAGLLTMLGNTGPLHDLLGHNAVLEPEQVTEAVWQGLQDNRFLILPHPEVGGYYELRAAHTERWLAGMNKLQRRLERAGAEAWRHGG